MARTGSGPATGAAPPRQLTSWRDKVTAVPTTTKGMRSRARLLDAAREVFAADGFQAARVADIAKAAGTSHGTFYTYFDSKEAVFWALILDVQEQLLGAHEAVEPVGDPIAAIERANRAYLAAFARHAGVMVVWEQVATLDAEVATMLRDAKRPFLDRTRRSIERLQALDRADPTLDPEYAAHALSGMVSRFAYTWFSQDLPFDLDVAVEQLTTLWANALRLCEGPIDLFA